MLIEKRRNSCNHLKILKKYSSLAALTTLLNFLGSILYNDYERFLISIILNSLKIRNNLSEDT